VDLVKTNPFDYQHVLVGSQMNLGVVKFRLLIWLRFSFLY